jgi:hypothetical protein
MHGAAAPVHARATARGAALCSMQDSVAQGGLAANAAADPAAASAPLVPATAADAAVARERRHDDRGTEAADDVGVVFVGGPWHASSRMCRVPLPARIAAPDGTAYIPWHAHPAAAAVLGGPLERGDTYVAEALEMRELLKRVEDYLLRCADRAVR